MASPKKGGASWFCICVRCGETGNYDATYVKEDGTCECGGALKWHGVYRGPYRRKLDAEILAFKQKHGIVKKSPPPVTPKRARKKKSGRRKWSPEMPCLRCGKKGVRVFQYLPGNNNVVVRCGHCDFYHKQISAADSLQWITKADFTGDPVEVLCVPEAAQ